MRVGEGQRNKSTLMKRVRKYFTKITMRQMLLLTLWLFSEAVRCEDPKIQLSAQEGGEATISCPYDSGYETYPKYFAKGDYGNRVYLNNTRGKKSYECKQKGKYRLYDDTNQRILHVTIRDLDLNDAGTYWCEIDAYTFDPRTEIKLEVYKAPVILKPPPITSKPPIQTTAQTITRNQQQSARTTVTVSLSSTTLWFNPTEDIHAASPLVLTPLAGKELLLIAAAAAILLLSLLLVLYLRLRKHRHDAARETPGRETGPCINTSSTQLTPVENHSQGQLSELDPSVNVSSSDGMYAVVTSRTGRRVAGQARVATPAINSSNSSCLQHEGNICSISSPPTEPGDQHNVEDVHLLYSTVCFNKVGAEQGQIRSAPTEVYATITKHPRT